MKKLITTIVLAIAFSTSVVHACDDSPVTDFSGYELEVDE